MSDLLNTLGKKQNTVADGTGKTSAPQSTTTNTSAAAEHGRGDDLLGKVGGKSSQIVADSVNASVTHEEPTKVQASSEEPTANDDWTKDSAMKEVKKLREENKAYRTKYQQEVEKLKLESDARLDSKLEELEALKQSKQELDRIKAEQEDKKRDITEKLANRETRIQELESRFQAKETEFSRKLSEQESIVRQFKAEREAEAQVYQNKVEEELSKIPAKYQDHAKLLVKGSEDYREALVALAEAKIKGMFDDKTIVVNHSTPGISDGARANKERLEDADKSRRQAMSSSQKIGEALKSIKSGNPNNVFRTK